MNEKMASVRKDMERALGRVVVQLDRNVLKQLVGYLEDGETRCRCCGRKATRLLLHENEEKPDCALVEGLCSGCEAQS